MSDETSVNVAQNRLKSKLKFIFKAPLEALKEQNIKYAQRQSKTKTKFEKNAKRQKKCKR